MKKFIFVCTIVSYLGATSSNLYSNNTDYVTSTNRGNAVKLISNDLEKFVKRYQAETKDMSFDPKYIENQYDVYLVDSGLKGTFFDFDGNRGYLLVDDSFNIYDISSSGQLDYFTRGVDVCFSMSQYGYLRDDLFVPFNVESEYSEEERVKGKYGTINYTAPNEGYKIRDYNYYMTMRYGSSYKYVKSNEYYYNTPLTQQNFLSFFNVNGNLEGNCGLAALYNSFHFGYYKYENPIYSWFSSSPTKYYASKQDSFYMDYLNNPKKYKEYSYLLDLTRGNKYPESYIDIRDWLVKNVGYKAGGTTSSQLVKCINGLVKEKTRRKLSAKSARGLSPNDIMSKIDKSCLPIIGVSDDIWGDHFMNIIGYRYYVKTESFWFFKIKTPVLLLQIADMHSSKPVYIDYIKYINTYYFDTVFVTY